MFFHNSFNKGNDDNYTLSTFLGLLYHKWLSQCAVASACVAAERLLYSLTEL